MFDIIQERYGWTDSVLLEMPWARIEQVLDVSMEQKKMESFSEWERIAFITWGFHINTPRDKNSYRTFKQWLNDMGIRRPGEVYADEIQLEKDEAITNFQKALQAFN